MPTRQTICIEITVHNITVRVQVPAGNMRRRRRFRRRRRRRYVSTAEYVDQIFRRRVTDRGDRITARKLVVTITNIITILINKLIAKVLIARCVIIAVTIITRGRREKHVVRVTLRTDAGPVNVHLRTISVGLTS